jgi:hypothetical protein
LFLAAYGLKAQPYNNEWIDFSKTYYKFKVGADGLYRIPQSVIAAAGLGTTPVQNFQLFRNGQEVPVYTSVASGVLGAADYIEFWGHANDGGPDKVLYRNPAYQHTDKLSFETDTAVYFLTVNPTGATFHYTTITNNVAGNSLPVEPYFMYKAATYFKSRLNPGYAQVVGEFIYSSSYDMGEFWSSGYINQSAPLVDNQSNLFVSPAGPVTATITFGATGCSDTLRNVQMSINGSLLEDTAMNSFNDLKTSVSFPVSLINSGSASVQFANHSQAVTYLDKMVVSYYEINYPRQFNFGGQANFYFELPARAAGYFLNITNFNAGSAVPVLYDMANGEQYQAVVSAGNVLSFELTGSANPRKLVLVSEDPANILTVNSLTQKTFINFSNTANQGNYIIISNPRLYTGSSGNNPVMDYKNYRSSAAGGGYNAQVIDINELVDQFAFGIKKHPISIKNFLNYARANYAVKPQYVFIIGRGMAYNDWRYNESNPNDEVLNPVPTFGYPASDLMLSSADATHAVPLTPIGRLAAISGPDVETYLQKVTEYEQAQQLSPNTVAGRDWMKAVVHVTGATDPFTEATLCGYMSTFRQIIMDTLFGANVYTFCSTDINQDNQVSSAQFPQLFSNGIGVLTYFGHSNASALGFNLDDPSIYNNTNKYPVFYVNGCYAGNFYTFDPARLTSPNTISENYVLTKQKGSIAFVASTHFGIIVYLGVFLNGLYHRIDVSDYGKGIGIIQADAAQDILNTLPTDFLGRCHAEEINLHGDPAIRINTETLPDYDIEPQMVKISPSFISVANSSFTVNASWENLGKAVNDSITVLVTRKYPDGSSTILLQKKVLGTRYMDSVVLSVPIISTRDKGQNYITVTIDAGNTVPEVTYANNSVTTSVVIYQDELTPVYPYNYAIVNNPTQKLDASTANPFAPMTQYVMEIDTTEAFNSPSLITKNLGSVGGVLEFDPGIQYRDSTVYYWRTSIVPSNGAQYHWNEFSFIYIDTLRSSPGFNQSHYFQHLQSTDQTMMMAANRQWQYTTHGDNLYIKNGVFPTAAASASDFTVEINGNTSMIYSVCGISGIIFNVFDPVTFKPWLNGQPGTSQYGSKPVCGPERIYNFQFNILDTGSRRSIVNFMDLIPDGSYVVVRNISGTAFNSNTYASDWIKDTSYLGSGNSMYLRLLQQGFTGIDSFNAPRAFIFVYQKNRPNPFTPRFVFSQGIYDPIFLSDSQYVSYNTKGTVNSPAFGPAKAWKQLHWRGSSLESPSTDSVGLSVIGTDTLGNHTTLYNLNLSSQDFDISAINAKQYPFLQLQLNTQDTTHATPYQLQYWRLNYLPVPEGALAPNIFLTGPDTVQLGQTYEFGIAFKNISITAFDSMRINVSIIDKNNVTHVIPMARRRPIVSGDTLKIIFDLNTSGYTGLNTLFLDVNPNNDQPEEYHFNNFLYKNFYVKVDQTNPLLDVTFDNVHILNDDIVSSRPHIQIKLKDESKYLLLNDTSLLTVRLRYPDGSLHPYYFNTDTVRFTPATNPSDNTAMVDFYPVFSKQFDPEGDEYQLIVTGKDKSGNPAGTVQYSVTFKIITKAMISNMLNYPNPFTTSTAFVFTITGSEVPQNIKIQILTITGKIVREITKDELGPLHIGRNITEFKWDGTDMFHQRLANGVYLYHVVTNLNGKPLDKYSAAGDNTDQYFIKGYGKMYLMR